MSSIFSNLNASWGTLSTINPGYGTATLSGGAGAMTVDTFVAATSDEQVRWLKSVGGAATIAGGYELALESSVETYQKGVAKKDASGNYVYDTFGRPIIDYSEATRTVEKVAVTQVDGLIPTAGQDEATIPYHNLDGSSSGGGGALNQATAEALFPSIDGLNGTLSESERPAGFDVKAEELTTAETIAAFRRIFNTWHSSYQVEWVNSNLTRLGIGNGVLQIPVSGSPVATYVASVPPPTGGAVSTGDYSSQPAIYQVDTLSKNDFSIMATQDQQRIAGTTAFLAMASSLGLSTERSVVVNAATALRDAVTGYKATNRGNASLPADAQAAFTDQLDLLISRLNKMGVFSPADINAQITEIQTRFTRLAAFYNVADGSFQPANSQSAQNNPATGTYDFWAHVGDGDTIVKLPKNFVSLDNNQTINSGYQVFLQQEKRIRDLSKARAAVADGDGYMNGKKLDAPSMIYYFQNQYNLEKEAKVTAETEEVKQQNAYLKTIAAMQKLINETLAKFKKADEDGKMLLNVNDVNFLQVMGSGSVSAENLETIKIMSMFSKQVNNTQRHPLEVLRNLDRPSFDLTRPETGGGIFGDEWQNWAEQGWDMEQRTHPQWSNYGTQLSELVTLVNQESQLKMNDINSMDRERNRHYDLANSALQKMADLIQSIAQVN
ncbi:MAG: hypothetical protein ACOH2J_16675 [Allorhizobium sp.]